MGRESSHGTKELVNLHLSGSAFCCSWVDIIIGSGMVSPRFGLGLVVEDGPTELSCTFWPYFYSGPVVAGNVGL